MADVTECQGRLRSEMLHAANLVMINEATECLMNNLEKCNNSKSKGLKVNHEKTKVMVMVSRCTMKDDLPVKIIMLDLQLEGKS